MLISETPPLLKWVNRTVITSLTRHWKSASPKSGIASCLVFTVKVEAMSLARHVVVLCQKSWSMTVKCVWTARVSLTVPGDVFPLQTWSSESFKGTDMYIGLDQWFTVTGLLFIFFLFLFQPTFATGHSEEKTSAQSKGSLPHLNLGWLLLWKGISLSKYSLHSFCFVTFCISVRIL